jgi:hypothetical protein
MTATTATSLPALVQGFFTDRLTRQRQASTNTIATYRDTIRLLLVFAATTKGKQPAALEVPDLDAPLIGAFLTHLEHDRGNGSATRNARLAAIHSLYRYAMTKTPEHALTISQVLAIPPRRRERAIVSFLTSKETDAPWPRPSPRTAHPARSGPSPPPRHGPGERRSVASSAVCVERGVRRARCASSAVCVERGVRRARCASRTSFSCHRRYRRMLAEALLMARPGDSRCGKAPAVVGGVDQAGRSQALSLSRFMRTTTAGRSVTGSTIRLPQGRA